MSKWLDLSLTYTHLNFKTPSSSRQAMNCILDLHSNPSCGQLFLGNINAANDSKYLSEHKVGAVLSVIDTSDIRLDSHVNRMWIMAEDCEEFDLSRFFDQGANFIRDHLQSTNVLVHCYAGISRSSSLVLAFMIKHLNYNLKDALRRVKTIRPQVEPNPGFLNQLESYERKFQEKSRGNSFHSNPRGSVASAKTSFHQSSGRPSYLDRQSVGPTGTVSAAPSPTMNLNNGHYVGKQQQAPRSFFKQEKPIEDPIKKYQKQKNLENMWYTSLTHKSTIEQSKSDKLDQVKMALQAFGANNTKTVFSSEQKNPTNSLHSLNSFRATKGRSLGNIKF